MADDIAFPEAKFYECGDPEVLSHEEPMEALEAYLDPDLNPRMTAAEVVAAIRQRPVAVMAYNPMKISEKQIESWADNLLESLGETFSDEHGNPDDGPCDAFPDDAEEVMRAAVASIIRRSHVWGCEVVGKVTLSPDQIETAMRRYRPDWFVDAARRPLADGTKGETT